MDRDVQNHNIQQYESGKFAILGTEAAEKPPKRPKANAAEGEKTRRDKEEKKEERKRKKREKRKRESRKRDSNPTR